MIDTHVHDRGWDQKHKETPEHILYVARRSGLSGIIAKPNTSPGITNEELAVRRLNEVREIQRRTRNEVFYGLEVGLTSDLEQVKRAVEVHRRHFPKPGDLAGVVGFKSYTIDSGGGVHVEEREQRKLVFVTLAREGYGGVSSWHAEDKPYLRPELWNPDNPITHCTARPTIAEYSAVKGLIEDAEEAEFKGTLVISHVSCPQNLIIIQEAKERGKIKIAAEVTPHHCILYDKMMKEKDGILKKVNPPLRTQLEAEIMLWALENGFVDLFGSDHAPHKYDEKTGRAFDARGKSMYMSGFPGIPFEVIFASFLLKRGMTEKRLHELTHKNAERIYGIEVPVSKVKPDLNLHIEYEVDVYKDVREKLGK